MKSNNKPKQSTNNKKRIIGDSSSRLVAGTLLGFIECVGRHSSKILIAALLTIACIPALFISSDTHATASSLSVSVSAGQDPSVNIAPTADGRFIASGTTTFSVSTTHAAGYKVTATSTALKDSTNTINTLTLPSGTSGITEANYEDNDYASENNLNNTWGYLPSNLCTTSGTTTTCAANTLYLPAPISATQTLDEVNSATNNTYDINIGTRVTTDTAQGAYATTFTVAVVGNATPYAITYNKNTTDTVSNMPTNHTTSDTGASGETVTLASNTPTRSNYDFQGWCTVAVADGANCTGTKYNAGATWTLNQTSSTNSLTLYAMWKAQATYIQNFTKANCQSLASSGNYTVTDSRDNNTYTVRYINGACWMTQNLRYKGDTGSASNSMTVKAATTNVSANKTISYTDLTSGNTYDAARIHDSGDTSKGVWYNYAAASAMTITGFSNNTVDTYNLCPKNWTLPTDSQQSGITSYSSAFSPVSGGCYSDGSLSSTGYGYWWSATAGTTTYRYYLYYNGSSLGTRSSSGYRLNGLYVRCIRTS